MRFLLFLVLAVHHGSAFAPVGEPQRAARLALDDVLQWVASGESEEVIIHKIIQNERPFDLTDSEHRELRRQGVSETIIDYLLDPKLPYPPPVKAGPGNPVPPPPPPGHAQPDVHYPPDEFAATVPPQVGAYLLRKSELVPVDLKTLLAANQAGALSKIHLTKGKVLGLLAGSGSRVSTQSSAPIFYLRLADPAKIEEVALVLFAVREQHRELEFAPGKDPKGKPSLKIETVRQFERVLVGPGLYRVSPASLASGEYFFYLMGSADPDKGIQGKGFDFGVEAGAGKEGQHP